MSWEQEVPLSPPRPKETYQGHQLNSGQISTHASSYSGQLETYTSSYEVKICRAVNDIKGNDQLCLYTHHSSKVNGHQWMAGQEEIIQPDNVAEVWQDVTKPGDQPTESENCAHLSSKKSINTRQISLQQRNKTAVCSCFTSLVTYSTGTDSKSHVSPAGRGLHDLCC